MFHWFEVNMWQPAAVYQRIPITLCKFLNQWRRVQFLVTSDIDYRWYHEWDSAKTVSVL